MIFLNNRKNRPINYSDFFYFGNVNVEVFRYSMQTIYAFWNVKRRATSLTVCDLSIQQKWSYNAHE